MRTLEKRLEVLEAETVREEDCQLIVVDDELPDGTLVCNGAPVTIRPAKHTLIIHRRPRR